MKVPSLIQAELDKGDKLGRGDAAWQMMPNAAGCIRLAEEARTSPHKSFFIEMAERWRALAEYAARTQW
jgi:hypothetical protein